MFEKYAGVTVQRQRNIPPPFPSTIIRPEMIEEKFGSAITTGNFNVHNAAWLISNKTAKASELGEDNCYLHGLEQHVHIPTRGPNTLDLILSDFPGNVTLTGHPPLGSSDHAYLLAIIPAPALRNRPTKRTVWRY